MEKLAMRVFKECILLSHKIKLAEEHNKSSETKHFTKTKLIQGNTTK
jgi:hypothetical protein